MFSQGADMYDELHRDDPENAFGGLSVGVLGALASLASLAFLAYL